MHLYEVTPGIYKIFSEIASLKTYRHGYFSKQWNETGYFCGMTLYKLIKKKKKLSLFHYMRGKGNSTFLKYIFICDIFI